ncbi:MAG: aspartate aminotransferase family protein [Pseudomonadota bacterium]
MPDHVFHRRLSPTPELAVSGRGIWLKGADGRDYLDAGGSGAGISAVGHGEARVAEAIARQAEKLGFIHGALFTTEPLEQLAADLVENAPPGLTRAFLTSGGSEANEAAIMMARQVAFERGQHARTRIISRRNSFHGATMGLLGLSGDVLRQRPFVGMLQDSVKVAPTYAYRDQLEAESDEAYGQRIAADLETAIKAVGPDTVLAFIAETIGGSSSGALTAPPGYYASVRDICDRYGVALIMDEVYCGLGRSGTRYAIQAEGIVPDYLVVAKGLAAGYAPIGAVLTSDHIHDTIAGGSGNFRGGFTHSGHTLSCAAALAVQRIVREEKLIANVATQGALLGKLLQERFAQHAHVGDVRGRGLLQSIELVADRTSKAPFDPQARLAAAISREASALGMLVNAASGTVDGRTGDHVLLAPPFIVTHEDIVEIVDRLGQAVDRAIARMPR